MNDRVLGGIGLALAAFFVWQATLIELSFISDPVGPRTFPVIIAVCLALACLTMIVKPDAVPKWPNAARLFEIAMATAVMVAYAILLPDLGFVITTAVAATYLTWRLGTAPLWAIVSGVSTSVGIWVVFRLVLGLSLARGPLGF